MMIYVLDSTENIVGKGENAMFSKGSPFNPVPHMPILHASNSAANKDMMSKILKNGDTIF